MCMVGCGGRGWRGGHYAPGPPGWARAGMGVSACGCGAPFAAAPSRQQQLDFLRGQAEYLKEALRDIRRRIRELERAPREA